jgi:hypothetical protein
MKRVILAFLIFFILFCLISPCFAQLDIRSFIPRISGYTGKLVVDAAYRDDSTKSDGEGSEKKETRISEKITFALGGFVYHPRFMLYRLNLSVGLGQSQFQSDTEDTGWKFRTGTEFEFRTVILPFHPYNLELYAARREPLIMGALGGGQTVITEKGAIFRYRKRPFSLNVDYNLLTTETDSQKTDNTRYSIRGSHSTGFINTSMGYLHSESSGDDSKSKTDIYTFSNSIRFWIIGLNSTIDYSDSEEKDISKTRHKSLSWKEDLRIDLPWNFQGGVSFNHLTTSFKREAEDSLNELDITNKTDMLNFKISHELFKSLRSSFNLDYITNKSDGAETKTKSGSLNFSYTKKIPIGRLFANFSGRNSITERTGTQFNIRERFLSEEGEGAEIILQQGANPDTVSVEVRGCTFDNEGNEKKITATLIRDDNYLVDIIDNRVTIEILSLSIQRGEDFIDIFQCSDPEGNLLPFEFLVTYGVSGDSKIETISRAYGLRFDFFGGIISPYYNRVELRQKILSGLVPFKPEDSQSDTIGITFNKPPFRLSGEYFQLKSEFRPSKGYKTSAEYSESLTPTLRIRIRTYFNRTELTKTKGFLFEEVIKKEVTEDAYGLNISAHKRFSRYLNLSLGGSVSKRKGESESLSYSFRGDLSWAIGKISLKTGAIISHSETEFKRTVTTRLNQYYYLKIERTLF